MCLLVYALLPRLLLLASAHWMLRRAERCFVHPDLSRIVDRMRVPLLGSAGTVEAPSTPLPLKPVREAVKESSATDPGALVGCALLLPPELADRVEAGRLSELTRRVCGYPDPRMLPCGLDPEDVRQALARCSGFEWIGGHERFVVLVEAWQPPIRENLLALTLLGQEPGRSLALVLCGRPGGGNWLTAPTAAEGEVWADAAGQLAPLRVDIFGADL